MIINNIGKLYVYDVRLPESRTFPPRYIFDADISPPIFFKSLLFNNIILPIV